MLTPSYGVLRQIQNTFSEAQNIKDLNKALKTHNLTAILTFGDLTLKLPNLELDGLDSQKLELSIHTNIQDLLNIDLMPIPGCFALGKWEQILLESLKAGIEESL